MKWAIAFGLYALGMGWMLWEIHIAPDAATALPMSRKCAWCGTHMSDDDHWLEANGAVVTHGICQSCASNLLGES